MSTNTWGHAGWVAALAVAMAGGCSFTENSGNDSTADAGEDSGDGLRTTTIYEVQQGNVPEGTLVHLKGVTVTSPVVLDENEEGVSSGAVLVQEADGGEFSGIYVFMFSDVVANVDIQIGDVVDVTGEYVEFFGFSEINVTNAADIEPTGDQRVPEPVVVNAADIATGGALAENYESVLVRVEEASVTDPDLGFGDFQVDGALVVDDLFIGPLLPQPGTTFTRLTGVLTYSFEEFRLAPRTDADVEVGSGALGPTATTVYEIRQGNVPEGSGVRLQDVVVTTPPSFEGDTFFVQEPSGGPFSGIALFVQGMPQLAVTVGDVVTVEGIYEEFHELSEIRLRDVEALTVTGSAAVPAPEVVAPADVATGGTKQEDYEGVLVRVDDVTVTQAPDMFGEFQVDDGLIVDDFFFTQGGPKPAVDQTYASIVGVMNYAFGDAKLSPRTLDDLVE